MEVLFLSSSYKKYIKGFVECHSQLKNVINSCLWVELTDRILDKASFIEELKEDIQNNSFKRIRLLIQSPDEVSEDSAFIYESFSYIIRTSNEKSIPLIFFVLKPDIEKNLKMIVLSLIDEIRPEDIEKGIYKFSGEIWRWDPQQFRKQCAANIARGIMNEQIKKEKESPFLPDTLLQWQKSPPAFFEKLYQKWVGEIDSLLTNYEFLVGWWSFIRNFGAGRKNGYSDIVTMLAPTHALSSDSDDIDPRTYLLLHRLQCPDAELWDKIWELKGLTSTFYYPEDLISLNGIPIIQFEQTYFAPPFQTEFWQRANAQFISSVEHIYNNLSTIPSSQERRTAIRQLRRDLSLSFREFQNIIDREIEDVLTQDIFRLLPERFLNAYKEFYNNTFRTIINFFPPIWRIRYFLGIPLPLWVPSLFYPLRSPLKSAIGMLRYTIKLLNFYYATYTVIKEYEKTLRRCYQQIEEIQKSLNGYNLHTDNILKELEIKCDIETMFGFEPERIERMNIENFKEAPESFPPEINTALEKLIEVKDTLNDMVEKLIINSRKTSTEENISKASSLVIFAPASFHNQEAWLASEEMVRIIEQDETFKKRLNLYMQEHGLTPDTTASYFLKKNERIDSLFREETIRKWKKKALKVCSRPFNEDMLMPHPSNQQETINFIISKGTNAGFWQRQNGNLMLNKEIFKWSSDGIRTIFFQRKNGVSSQELLDKINELQTAALRNWFSWQFGEESPDILKQVSQFDLSRDKEEIIKNIFAFLAQSYTPKKYPVHSEFGALEFVDGSYFILRNTYNKDLMKLFSPDTEENCIPRPFTQEQIKFYLSNQEKLPEILGLFFNYSLVEEMEELIDEFKEFFSC